MPPLDQGSAPSTLIVIPARMASTRLPDKPLADIAGQPMIVHVWRRAMASNLGRVIVATDSTAIVDAISAAGGEAIMTRADHASGSDRIFEAVGIVDPDQKVEFVINLQGDLPTLDPALVQTCLQPLLSADEPGGQPAVQIATLAATITESSERSNPNVVKVVGTPVASATNGISGNRKEDQENTSTAEAVTRLRALYFTRATAPYGEGPLYHHIGIYAYRRAALQRFVSLPASLLEQREKLEQLRALEDGMRIDVTIVDTIPLGVDTQADLERARKQMAPLAR